MIESNNLTESNEKSEYYENKMQRLTNDLEIQNQKRNQEMEELFEEIETENNTLKKELIETKEELEEEKEKNNGLKNSVYNFNYYIENSNNIINKKINKNNNNEKNYNSEIFSNNIKLIKEENAKKISELSYENEDRLKNFTKNWNYFENNINSIINLIKKNRNENFYEENIYNNNQLDDIIKKINEYNHKISSLINENYSNKKFSIILQEKLELANEEIYYLKQRIIQEKNNILEKINDISHMNLITHINFAQEIINEINSKRKNYYNDQFFIPIENLHQLLLESKDKERELNNKNISLEKELSQLKYKYDQITEEKNTLLNNASNSIADKERDKTNELFLYSQINKYKKEKEVIENENNILLKNNNKLNEQIISINNKIQYELSKANKNNEILLIQKSDLINELNNKLNNMIEINVKNKMMIEELTDEINDLKNNLNEYKTNEGNYKNEIISLKKKIKETEVNFKTTLNQTNTIESINKTYNQRITNLQTEKKSIENKYNLINNKYNSLITEKNKMNDIINNYRNKNNELELLNRDLSNRLTTTDKNIEELSSEKEMLYNIQNAIKQIYINHIIGDNNNENINNISEINMLKEINDKLNDNQNNSDNNQLINVNIIYNEDFAGLEQNKNSQLYENILLYLFHIKSQNKIEINRIISNYSESNYINKNQNNIFQILDNLKNELDEKCMKFEERLKLSVNVDEIEQLVGEIKNLYETVIDNIIQFFYNHKTDLSPNNILTIQMPLDKYHQIINNTNSNLSNIESTIVNKINYYKGQGNKIENALNILIENVNNLN